VDAPRRDLQAFFRLRVYTALKPSPRPTQQPLRRPVDRMNGKREIITMTTRKRLKKVKVASLKWKEYDAEVSKRLLSRLKQGVTVWNKWRRKNPAAYIDLRGATLAGMDFSGVNLSEANLHSADLSGQNFDRANLSAADLYGANLQRTHLNGADLSGAYLSEADLNIATVNKADLTCADLSWAGMLLASFDGSNLTGASLEAAYMSDASFEGANFTAANLHSAIIQEANLSKVDLSEANLTGVSLVDTDLSGAKLNGCRIYGISAWNLNLEGTEQTSLVITPESEPIITVDNLEVAQFVYLLLNNPKIRDVIDTIAKKAVLILGRFTPERKAILDALREELRRLDYLPILFDFDKPSSRNLTETVSTLAHLARFVIADITDAKSIPQELQRIIPYLPSLPVQPIILDSQYEYAMFRDFLDYQWVLKPYRYRNREELLASLEANVITPAIVKAQQIEERRKAIEKQLAG